MIRPAETETVDVLSGSRGTAVAILPPGTRLHSRYRLRDVLGIGGSAVVYAAEDCRTSRMVALKLLRADRSTEAALLRFRYEAAVGRIVDCPHLVRVLDYAEGERTYLTMEVAREGSLRQALRAGPLPVATALSIAEQVLCALSALHENAIVHGDVKPANILLDAGGRVLLGDLGLARRVSPSEAQAREPVMGTLEYLAPEQVLGRDVDVRSDLYALGVVLFEMLAGVVPHRRASSLGTLLAHLQQPAQDIRSLRAETPQWLATLIAGLLDKQPVRRHASAQSAMRGIASRSASVSSADGSCAGSWQVCTHCSQEVLIDLAI